MDNKRVNPKLILESKDITICESRYAVRSQTRKDVAYDVRRTDNRLACNCSFDGDCHHMGAVPEMIKARGTGFRMVERTDRSMCKFCGSAHIIKKNMQHNKSGNIQRYMCKDCDKWFSLNLGFEKMRYDSSVITRSIGMYFAKMSVRRIADQLEMEGVDVSYRTVYNWVSKYSKMRAEYTDGIIPDVGKWFWADEVWVRVNGQKYYLFATMGDETRYWLAEELADNKERHNAEDIFRMTKRMAGKAPSVMITDKLHAYDKVARKVFPKAYHKADAGIRSGRPGKGGKKKVTVTFHKDNNKMERLNGEIRDCEVNFHGLKSDKTALFTGMRVYYNFAKKHGGIGGKTPTEAGGIIVEGRNKWLTLIQNAALERHLGG